MTFKRRSFWTTFILLFLGACFVFGTSRIAPMKSSPIKKQNAELPLDDRSINDDVRTLTKNEENRRSGTVATHDKRMNLSKDREHRPLALTDYQLDTASDSEKQQRYSMRAARAARLNERLQRRINELNLQITNATPNDKARLESEIEVLRDNQLKRQALENAAYPTQARRSSSD